MLRNILKIAFGAMLAAMVGTAYAVIGTAPGTGPGLTDGAWLNGLANGHNHSYVYGLTAAGSSHATATQLAAQVRLYQIDTAPSSSGVALPAAVAGGIVANLYNAGANTVTVYPSISNNPVTSAQDTINSLTSTPLSATASILCFAAKPGVWACR